MTTLNDHYWIYDPPRLTTIKKTGQRCASGCGAYLSRYNQDIRCWPCQERELASRPPNQKLRTRAQREAPCPSTA